MLVEAPPYLAWNAEVLGFWAGFRPEAEPLFEKEKGFKILDSQELYAFLGFCVSG